MNADNTALKAKRAELVSAATVALGPDNSKLAERLVEAFCSLSPPEQQAGPLYDLVTAHSGGYRGGETRKSGNLRLNWKRLCGEFGDIALNAAGAIAAPWLIPFAALSLWNKFWTHATIPLTKEQASSLFAMWTHCDDRHRIPTGKGLDETNSLFTVFRWPALTADDFTAILDSLEHLDCIEHDKDEQSIWLREWVKSTYK